MRGLYNLCSGPVPPEQMAKESRTDRREKRWLVCQTGIVAVRVIPQVGAWVRVIRR
jgi:hypothetical protein